MVAALIVRLGAGFVAIRKLPGLLPGAKVARVTPADYRGNRTTLRMQRRSLDEHDRALLVDDWFETGSQALTAKAMVEEAGAVLIGAAVMVDQLAGPARRALGVPLTSLIPAAALGPSEPRLASPPPAPPGR